MGKTPKTIERIRSTGAMGQFPGAILGAVEHDVYVLKADADAALADAQATIARLEAALRWIENRKPKDIRSDGSIGPNSVEHGQAAHDMWACARAALSPRDVLTPEQQVKLMQEAPERHAAAAKRAIAALSPREGDAKTLDTP